MLDNFSEVFGDMNPLLKRLKKKRYEENMEWLRQTHGHYFKEMTELMEQAQDKENTASDIAAAILDAAENKLKRWGRIPGYAEVNLTFFLIYYIFPAILLEESPHSTALADALQEEVKRRFKNSNIRYADYQTIHDGFNEKILGLFGPFGKKE